MSDKYYTSDILELFNRIETRIDKLFCFVKDCCAKIPFNVGTGIGIYKTFKNGKWEFKSLLEGDNITLTETANEIIISSTAITCEDIDNCLGISESGEANKFLNEQGDFVTVSGSGFTCSDLIGCNISNLTNDSGYITSSALSPYLTSATAATTYYPLTNPSNFISLSSLSSGTGINYNNLTGVITNSAPDQVVSLTQGGTTTITGTYPNFTISSADQFTGTVTSVGLTTDTTGTDVNVSGSPITSSGSITLNIPIASATNTGKLSSSDWSLFNSKQASLGFTPENVANKATTFGTINNTLYPTVEAVNEQINLKTGTTIALIAGDVSNTSSATPIVATGLTFALEANKRYRVTGAIRIGCNNTGGVQIGTNLPSGATFFSQIHGVGTGITAYRFAGITTPNGTGGIFAAFNATVGGALYNAEIHVGATAGDFEIIFNPVVNLQTATIYDLGTFLTITEI